MTVLAAKPGPKLEPVSKQLKRELIHPNRNSSLGGLAFSPDGTKLIGGDYPGGTVMVWDVASGRQLVRIETGYGFRSSLDFFSVSPNWKTIYVPREKAKYEKVEKDGKQMYRWEFDGSVRAWDLATGELVRTYKHEPARNISTLRLSPDGGTFVTGEELPGIYEGRGKRSATFWDVKSGQHRPLPDALDWYGHFSPDGKTYVGTQLDDKGRYSRGLRCIDVATGKDQWSVPVTHKSASLYVNAFSPDGKMVIGDYRVSDPSAKRDRYEGMLKMWDARTGRELVSIPAQTEGDFFGARFAPDSRVLTYGQVRGETRILNLFDIDAKKPTREIKLVTATEGERILVMGPYFRPDGKWLAVMTQVIPKVSGRELDVQDTHQARIQLIDVAVGEVRQTLIAPPGFPRFACFSPDGKTLATGGHGRALLWDVSDLK